MVEEVNHQFSLEEWPFFPVRYPPIFSEVPPVYWEGAVLLLLFLLAVGGGLYYLLGKITKGRPWQFLLLRSSEWHGIRESVPSTSFFFLTQFYSSIIVGAVFTVYYSHYYPLGLSQFWLLLLFSSLGAGLLSVGLFMFRGFLLCTFAGRDLLPIWGLKEALLHFWWSLFLLFPLALMLFTTVDVSILEWVLLMEYVAYRFVSFWVGLSVYGYLLKYPLHIIWYLCACEVMPVMYMVKNYIPVDRFF